MNGRNVPVLGAAMVVFAVHVAHNATVNALWALTAHVHRARRIHHVCLVLGHTFPDLTVCTRTHCTTRFDRVREGARPR